MRKCNKCKKAIASGYLLIPRGTRCQDCFEQEMSEVEWKCASELDENDVTEEKGLYNDEDYVFIKENGRWVMTNKFFTLFD